MTCTEIQYLIDEIGDLDRLPPDAARHVDACRACERFGRELVSLRSLLREPGRMQAPADFDARLARRLRTARATRERRPVLAWLAAPRHGLAATAAAALLVVGGLAVSRVATEQTAPAPADVAVVAPAPPTSGTPGLTTPGDPTEPESVDPGPRQLVAGTPSSAQRRTQTPRPRSQAQQQDAMILVSDDAGTHMVNVPAVLVGAEQILPTAGATPTSAGVAF
jgi:hypothetical protein